MRQVERLEARRLLASFTASSVAELIADMNAANAAGGSNTITLAPGAMFRLTTPDNVWGHPNGLPVIAAGNDLTIVGNGDTIERSTATGTPAFRLLGVATGGTLTLNNLTLSNGLAFHPSVGVWGQGGAIDNQGTLSLSGVTIQNCVALGHIAYPSFGGGIYSSGTLTISNSVLVNNQSLGGDGAADGSFSISGNTGLGGGLYVAGGTATLTNTTVTSNLARGGNGANGFKSRGKEGAWFQGGGNGGDAFGGGIYAYSNATVTLRGTTITRNIARGGTGGSAPKGLPKGADGVGRGGGLYVAANALVSLDPTTQMNIRSNSASTSDADIFGSFSVLG